MKKIKFFCGLIFVTACMALQAAPQSNLWQIWQASDEANTQPIDHSAWQYLLSAYLVPDQSGINLFDYQSASKYTDLGLNEYLQQLQRIDPRSYPLAEQKAYWINLYNALTVDLILDNYPVESITDLGKGFFRFGPWDDAVAEVVGESLSLNDIEHRILRPIWNDDRIHFAVNCASLGCPNLQSSVFTASNTEGLLNLAESEYLTHPRGIYFDEAGMLRLSSIFDWYGEDFGGRDREILNRLSQYVPTELADKLRSYSGRISYEYDWTLNEVISLSDNL